jgi:VWFA-related protein
VTRIPALSRCVFAALALSLFPALSIAQSGAAPSDGAQSQVPSPTERKTPAQTKPDGVPASTSASGSDSQAPTMTIRQTVRRVIVDVTVQDANGKPVHGLTANDFSVTEDKQPQRVLSFDVYDFDKPSISRGPNAPALPPNLFVNVPMVPERGPLYVMLYDLVNTGNQMWATPQILKFIRSKPAGTRFAIFVNSDGLYLLQGFTDDKGLLYAALDPNHPKHHMPRVFLYARNYGAGNACTAVDVLTHIGKYLDGIPGRKNLIWASDLFPLPLGAEEGDSACRDTEVQAELNALAQAQVAIFPLDLTGVDVNPGALIKYATEDIIASETGGRAFYSTNDVTAALDDATEQGANYYTLSYAPPSEMDDGKCHRISVKLDKGNYQLSYRRNYCRVPEVSTETDENLRNADSTFTVPLQAGDVLQANMKLGAPMLHDLVFSAHVRTDGGPVVATPAQMEQLQEQAAFYRTHRRNKPAKPLPPVKIQTYSIDYRVLDPQFKARAERTGKQPTLEFTVAAFDDDGRVLNGIVNDGVPEESTQPSENKAGLNKTGLFRIRQTLVVPLNAKSIRVGVRDRMSDRMGTLEVPLPLKPEPVTQASNPAH